MGLTPIDTGYTYAGYVIAGAMMSYFRPLFIAVAIGSLIWMVYHSLLQGSAKPTLTYFITLFLLVSVFMPSVSPPAPVSAAQGKEEISSQQVAQQILGSKYGGQTSAGLVWIGRLLDSFAITAAKLIESGGAVEADGRVVGGIPFLYTRAYTEMMGNRIRSPETREEFVDFFGTSYADALQRWENAGKPSLGIGKSTLYPGDIIDKYGTPEDRNKWKGIEEKMSQDFQKTNSGTDGWWARVLRRFDKRRYIINTVKNELADDETVNSISERILANSTYSTGTKNKIARAFQTIIGKGPSVFLSHLASALGYILTSLILPALPMMQGMLNLMVLVAFPFVFLFCLFPHNFAILPKYFLTLLWVKSLTIAWAIVNCFQNFGWVFASAGGETTLSWAVGSVPILGTLVGITVLPAIFFKIIAEGLSYTSDFMGSNIINRGGQGVGKAGEKAEKGLEGV
ncbi:MAG TPA: conjugal transfer protein TraG N-terminal domain-containing protein [Candidatus Ratteibacteria bacterium]|nr:conjugal transfer protein TraG N-terminal domain-containing protein [Candidatus Ratteibacteria bacterium]